MRQCSEGCGCVELGRELSALWKCRTVTFTVHTARVPAPHNHSHHNQFKTSYEAVHTLVLLMMDIIMPETCCDKSLIINTRLVASCWFLSLHPTFMMHGHKSLKFKSMKSVKCINNQQRHFNYMMYFCCNIFTHMFRAAMLSSSA